MRNDAKRWGGGSSRRGLQQRGALCEAQISVAGHMLFWNDELVESQRQYVATGLYNDLLFHIVLYLED
jgi:hypothetical protein